MTDNEIIKALECCADHDNIDACDDCPCLHGKCISTTPYVLDLINRQKAEIERLCMELDEVIIAKDLLFDEAEALIKKTKAEAVKEFAERLKEMSEHFWEEKENFVSEETIDNLVKEMVGEG